MGNYLNKPITEKHSIDGEQGLYPYRWAASEMQGWRMNMEDSYFLDFETFKNNGFYAMGIFDGHGGCHVARYAASHISEFLLNFINIHNGDLSKALKSSYLGLDTALSLPDTQDELSQLSLIKRDSNCNVSPNFKQAANNNSTTHCTETSTKSDEEIQQDDFQNEDFIIESDSIASEKNSTTHIEMDQGVHTACIHSSQTINITQETSTHIENKENESPKNLKSFFKKKKNNNSNHIFDKSHKKNTAIDEFKPSTSMNDEFRGLNESKTWLSSYNNFIFDTFRRYFSRRVPRFSQSVTPSLAMNAGCTAVTCLITEYNYIVANAGDSRCVLCRGTKALDLSKDHKPDLDSERSRIIYAGGFLEAGRVNGNLNLSRALGDLTYKQNPILPQDKQIISASPELTLISKSEEDEFIILGCDGIWETLSSQEIIDFVLNRIKTTTNLSAILDKLFESLISPDPEISEFGCDNMTAIIIDLKKCRET